MRIRKKKMIPVRFEDYTDYFAYLFVTLDL